MDNEHRVVATTCSILSLLGIDMLVLQASRAMSAHVARKMQIQYLWIDSLYVAHEATHLGISNAP